MSLPSAAPTPDVLREARALARLVLGRDAPPRALQRYCEAQVLLPALKAGPRALLDFVVAHPALAPFVDGGLALRAPRHPVRQRLLVMLAILETETSLADTFLPPARVTGELVRVLFVGARAACLAATGALLLSLVAHD